METNPTPHLDASLQKDIKRIRRKVRQMAHQVKQALVDSRTALMEQNGTLAYSIILRDQRIDDLEQEVDRILSKISQQGEHSLTDSERKTLSDASRRARRRMDHE